MVPLSFGIHAKIPKTNTHDTMKTKPIRSFDDIRNVFYEFFIFRQCYFSFKLKIVCIGQTS